MLAVDEHGMAAVRTPSGVERVDTTLVCSRSAPGDLVLVHAGTAIAVLPERSVRGRA